MDANRFSLHGEIAMKPDDREKVANIVPFGLRMQPDLKRRVEEAARANGRSLNAEITHRLEISLRDNNGAASFAWAKAAKANAVQIEIEDLKRRVLKLEQDR